MRAPQPLLYFLPKAALSTVVVFAVIKLVDLRQALKLWHCSVADFGVWLTAFIATLFLGVILGIAVALGLSMALFVYFATRPRISELGRLVGTVTYQPLLLPKERAGGGGSGSGGGGGGGGKGALPPAAPPTVVEVRGIKILRFEAPLFFVCPSAPLAKSWPFPGND